MTLTLMACLPEKQTFRDNLGKFSYYENVFCVFSLELHQCDSYEYTQPTISL